MVSPFGGKTGCARSAGDRFARAQRDPSATSTTDFRGRPPWGPYIQAKWLLRQAFSDVFLSRSDVSNYFKLFSGGSREEAQPRSFLTPAEKVIGYFPVRPDGSTEGARARRVGINEKGLLESPGNEPKPGYYAYQNLCALLDRSYRPVDRVSRVEVLDPGVFSGIGPADDAFPSVPIVATFEGIGGRPLVAYWLPWHGQEYLPRLARVRLRVSGAWREPVLVDLISGDVWSLPGAAQATDGTTFDDLPLADYPFSCPRFLTSALPIFVVLLHEDERGSAREAPPVKSLQMKDPRGLTPGGLEVRQR